MDAAEAIHAKFVAKVGKGKLPRRASTLAPGDVGLAGEAVVELFYSQCVSRQLDRHLAPAAGARRGLLHDRQLGPREQCRGRRGAAPRRHGLPPLPLQRLPDPPLEEAARPDPGLGHAAELRRLGRGSDLRRPPQGDRLEAALHPAADQHHRLASAQGGRRGVQHRHRPDAEAGRHAPARTMRSSWPASATPRPIIRPRRARSTAPPGPPIRARRCRSSSSARTMASASRRGRRAAGSAPASATGPGCDYVHCSGLDMVDAYRGAQRGGAHRPQPPRGRSSSTWIRSGSTAMPAPTCRPPI